MKAIIQRVSQAQVMVAKKIVGQINKGFLVLLGVAATDTQAELDYMIKKIYGMRIFEDENEKMNLALSDVGGKLLVVSQFTLLASTKKGNRPSFTLAGAPDMSEKLYEEFIARFKTLGIPTQSGCFGAHMEVSLVNDGPVTIILDTQNIV